MREIVHIQAGQCGNQIGAKVSRFSFVIFTIWVQNAATRPAFCDAHVHTLELRQILTLRSYDYFYHIG